MGENDARVLELVRTAVGHACWSAIASERTDYVIVLDIGEKRRRSMRLANPRLSFLQRTYEGEFSFLIECNWRLDGPEGVVVSCYDSNALGGTMLGGLAELEGRTIEDIDVSSAAFDLTIAFSGDYVMRCLSTETDLRGKRSNWSFWSPLGLVTCGARGRVKMESREDAEAHFQALKKSLAQEEDDDDVVARWSRARDRGDDDLDSDTVPDADPKDLDRDD